MEEKNETVIEPTVTDHTRERISFLANPWGLSERLAAEKLPAEQAEAEAGPNPGPWLRKYMYR